MPSTTRLSRIVVRIQKLSALAMIAGVLTASPARAAIFQMNVNNNVNTELGFGILPLAFVSGPGTVTGSLTLDVQFDNNDVTSIQILDGSLQIGDTTVSGDVNIFGIYPGTLSATFTGVAASVSGGPFSVSGGSFAPDGTAYNFAQGTLDILLDSTISGPVPLSKDFGASPDTLLAIVGSNPGTVGWDGETLSLDLPIQIGTAPTTVEGIDVYFVIQAQISGTAVAAVPEASSLVMIAAGVAAAGVVRRIRRVA